MTQLQDPQNQEQLKHQATSKIKSARVFAQSENEKPAQPTVKPGFVLADDDAVELTDEPIEEQQTVTKPAKPNYKKTTNKWLWFLIASILIASCAELAIFIKATVENMDWLAGIWLGIFTALGVFIMRLLYIEFRGLKQLKQQQDIKFASEQMASTSVIGLGEKHCLLIAERLPKDYQYLVQNWQQILDLHHSDAEVLALFEHQVLAPIDKLALKQVRHNASAAGVMIAVSPFALLDMLIVLWRNIQMMNQISEIYGLHLGYWGRIWLIRNIFHTMLYAGAAEILSDAGNYALSAGLTGKISTRIAQGLGAGVLTARIGLKAINQSRPMPWLSQAKPSLSGISKELLADLNKQLK